MYKIDLHYFLPTNVIPSEQRESRDDIGILKPRIFRLSMVFLFLFLLFLYPTASHVYAETRTSGSLSVTGDFPVLSSSDGVWYPGKTIVKEYLVEDSGSEVHDFAVKTTSLSDPDLLAAHLFMAISEGATDYFGSRNGSGNALSSESIKSFYDTSNPNELVLFNISAATSKTVKYTFTMDSALGDGNYQNKNLSFDLSFGYSVIASPTPTPTETPGPTSTPVPGPTSTPGPGPTSTPGFSSSTGGVAGATLLTGGFVNLIINPIGAFLSDILGAQVGTVSGVASESTGITVKTFCLSAWWWILVFVVETAISTVLVFYGRKKESVKYILGQAGVTFLAIIVTAILFCEAWPIIVAGLIGVAGIVLLLL